jgi:hypothetical protein
MLIHCQPNSKPISKNNSITAHARHGVSVFYEYLPAQEAFDLAQRFDFNVKPKEVPLASARG